MRAIRISLVLLLAAAGLPAGVAAQDAATPAFDAATAERVGADANGMRRYVLVILKTGPTPVTDTDARKAMFAGHFANMERLAKAGKLALAGPFGRNDVGWRGLFLLAVDDVGAARELAETDPVIVQGEMVAEYHPWFGSAAAMLVPELHETLVQGAAP